MTPDSKMTRRELLANVGMSLIGFTISSAFGDITPAEAREKGVPLHNLSASEGRLLEAFGDVLLPGAAEAGIAHYVDDQLGRSEPLLFLKYMDYVGSYVDFYKQGLSSLEQLSRGRQNRSFLELTPDQSWILVREISQKNLEGWSGPPAPLFYFVVRNDAVDVYYGTPEGFAKLGVPYMPMLEPPDNR
jgi:hypothetical protein